MVQLAAAAAVLASVVGALITLAGQREHERTLAALAPRMVSSAQLRAAALLADIDDLRSDTLFLRQVPHVADLVQAAGDGAGDRAGLTTDPLWRSRSHAILAAFMESNKDIRQIVLFGVASPGPVLGGVRRAHGRIVAVEEGAAQAPALVEAVAGASSLRAGQAWVSPLSATVSGLYAASPVFDADGARAGTLAVSYDSAPALARLRTALSPEFVLYLLDAQGRDLLTSGATATDRWDRAHPPLPQDEREPAALRRVDDAGTILHVRTVALSSGMHGAASRLILGLPDKALAPAVRQAQLWAGFALGVALLLAAALFMAFRQMRRRETVQRAELAAIADHAYDAIIGQDGSGRITSWNRSAACLFGYPHDTAIGQSADALCVPPALREEQRRARGAVLAGGAAQSYGTVRCRADGSQVQVMTTLSPLPGVRGRIAGVVETIRDLTAEQEYAHQIEANNLSLEQQVVQRTAQIASAMALQRAILDHAGHAVIATDLQGLITVFNPAAESMLGYHAAALIGQATPALLHDPAQLQARASLFAAELGDSIEAGFAVIVAKSLGGLANEHEWTYIRADGSTLTVMLSVTVLRGADGGVSGFLCMAVDVSAQRAQEQALSARHRFLDIVSQGLPGMVAYWDDGLICRFANHAYLDWFGRSREDMLGLHLRTLLGEKLFLANQAPISAALAGAAQHFERELTMANGEKRQTWAHYIPDIDQGKVRGFIVLVSDVTALKSAQMKVEALNRTLEARTEQAESASRAKSTFLANMSHEIRTPMNAVLGMLQLPRLSDLDERQHDHAGKADTAARGLLRVLDDILDFSRVEAGKLALDPQPFELDAVLRNVAVILADGVGDKPIELVLLVAPDVPHAFIGDAMRLQQILINLCGNAIKFTAAGEVALRVCRAADSDTPLTLAFTVADTGIGIPADQCARIFDGFSQAETSTARRYGGSGLGLAISQRLAHLMGGTLSVTSTPGVGSRFDLSVPLQALPAQRPALAAPGGILLVESHPTARYVLAGYFEAARWPLQTLDSGVAALALCAEATPAVVYLSVAIDDVAPRALVTRLRRQAQDRPLRVIGLMASHAAELQARRTGVAALFDSVLVKPVVQRDLLAAASASPSSLRGSPRAPLAGMRVLLVEDNPLNQQVAGELLRIAGASVEVASSAPQALDALRAGPAYDVVLMDVQMPDMDGYTATGLIRNTAGLAQQIVIAVTANAMADDRGAALAAGMNDHLGKPFDLQRLCEVILRHTRPGAVPAASCKAPPVLPSLQTAGPAPLAPDAALARMDGSRPVYLRALAGFAAELDRFEVAADAACAGADAAALMACCHTVKGVSAMVGADEMAALSGAAEAALRGGAAAATIDCQALRQAAVRARAAARQALGPAQETVADDGASADLPPALERLQQQLLASNLAALTTFESVRATLARQAPEHYVALAAAIGQLQFSRAATLCGQLRADIPI